LVCDYQNNAREHNTMNDTLRGGKRKGAGRPKGSGKFGEATVPVRVPASMAADVALWVERKGGTLPLYSASVRAGLPTAADDHVEDRVDLAQYVAPRPDQTFLVRVQGDSMLGAGMDEGDLLVVDKSLPAKEGCIVVASLDGDATVKRLRRRNGTVELVPENEKYKTIVVGPEQSFEILGVVTTVVHKV
jgi:DNA polymerase V